MKSQYITDNTGNRMAVILPIEEYSQILNELEELDAIRAYDAAKASKDEVIPFDQAIKDIENYRN